MRRGGRNHGGAPSDLTGSESPPGPGARVSHPPRLARIEQQRARRPRSQRASSVGPRGAESSTMKILQRIAVSVLVLYVGMLAGLLAVMRQPTLFGRVIRRVPGPASLLL